ncbi:MAG: D-2-hydroxyacid dehydrogenase [Elainellaceae cyanobacterium]
MKLILPTTIADSLTPQLNAQYDGLEVVWASEAGDVAGDIADAEIFVSDPDFNRKAHRRVLESAPALRWYHSASAGVDHLVADLRSRDIRLTNSAGVFAGPIAETVMGYILAQSKAFFHLRSQQSQHIWSPREDYEELADKVLLIVGAGGIGQAIARRAAAFDMRLWGSRRHPQPQPPFERVVGADAWKDLLPEAHYVVLTTPLTPETEGMLDGAALAKMRADAYLINVGRGALILEQALVKVLQQRRIAGAALDTVVTEPLPQGSPFWELDNVFITPHASGLSPRNNERIAALFLDNLSRYRDGTPLRNEVDLSLAY